MYHSIGGCLKAARQRSKATAAELAARVGVTEAAIRKIEGGGSKQPSFLTGLALARELGISPFVLGGVAEAPVTGDLLAHTIAALRARRLEHEAMGIARAAVFGSVARGDATDNSDIDVLVELAPHASLSLLKRSRIMGELSDALGRRVDVVRRDSLPESGYESAFREAIYAY